MTKIIDSTNLGYLISKIKAAFWGKSETTQVSIDDTPTANSNNLVKSGGVKSYVDSAIPSDIVQDVTVGGTSVVSNGVAAVPSIPSAPGTLNTNISTAQSVSSSEALSGSISLHKISKTGNFSDLIGAPDLSSFVTAEEQSGSTFPIIGDPSNYYTKDETDAVAQMAVEETYPEDGFEPNVLYTLGTISGSQTFILNTSLEKEDIANLYYWTFNTGSSAPTITWPSQITSWYIGAPTISANKHYEISILEGIAVCVEV